MVSSLVTLSWFDIVSVTVPVATIIVIHFLKTFLTITNAIDHRTSTTILAAATTTTSDQCDGDANDDEPATNTKVAPKNGKLHKQKSENCEDSVPVSVQASCSSSSPSPASSPNSSPNSSARNSLNFLSNNGHSNHTIPLSISPPLLFTSITPEPLTDEFHEDEDTLSLDNLFPCDQSELYASKKINFIIDELIHTETNYVEKMRQGLRNYGHLMAEREDLPDALKGNDKQRQLLGNIEEILKLHEEEILPLMLRNRHDLKALFDQFAAHFNKNHFYCYVAFMMNKKSSMQLRQEQRDWLLNYQTDINDKLGIDSFLVQPIQRLTRYPLLLQQFISEFYKSGINCKPVVMSVCKLETRLRRQLDVVNQSEEILSIEDLNDLNLCEVGNFHKCTEFDAYHYRSRKKYRAKVFLFDRCLVCTEVRKRRLTCRHHYRWDLLELRSNHFKSITILVSQSKHTKIPQATTNYSESTTTASTESLSSSSSLPAPGFKEEYDLIASESNSVTQWMRCACTILEKARREAIRQNQFSLPMDLVLGVGFAIWFIWHFL